MKQDFLKETLSQVVNRLAKEGYTADFKLLAETECIGVVCNNQFEQLSPTEFTIDEIYRFDGRTNPDDESIVYAISSKKHGLKGLLIDAYGTYSDSDTAKIVELLQRNNRAEQ